jgi:hypothetical protein
MDDVDNTVLLAVLGATDAGAADSLFWASFTLAVAAVVPLR